MSWDCVHDTVVEPQGLSGAWYDSKITACEIVIVSWECVHDTVVDLQGVSRALDIAK